MGDSVWTLFSCESYGYVIYSFPFCAWCRNIVHVVIRNKWTPFKMQKKAGLCHQNYEVNATMPGSGQLQECTTIAYGIILCNAFSSYLNYTYLL